MNKADQPLPLGSLGLSQVGESLAYLDVKNTIKSVKIHLIEWMNLFVNPIGDKVLLSSSVTKLETTQLKKMGKGLK